MFFGILFIVEKTYNAVMDYSSDDSTLYEEPIYKISAYKNCVIQVLDITGSKATIYIRYFDNDNSTDEVAIKQFLINRFAGITLSNISSEEFDNLINELKDMCTLVEISIESI